MLSLQIILTYKSRLKYGNQKNSWEVSMAVKHQWWHWQSLHHRAGCERRWKWVFWSQYESVAAKCHLAEEMVPLKIRTSKRGSLREPPAFGDFHLSVRATVACQVFLRHPVSAAGLWRVGFPLSGLCLWGEQVTEPLTPAWHKDARWRSPDSSFVSRHPRASCCLPGETHSLGPAVKKNFTHPN